MLDAFFAFIVFARPAWSGEAPPGVVAEIPVEVRSGTEAEVALARGWFDAACARYPRLCDPALITKFIIVTEKIPGAFAAIPGLDEGAVVARFTPEGKTVTVNPRNMARVPGTIYPDVYRAETIEESIVFHEMLHSIVAAKPGLDAAYEVDISKGRMSAFLKAVEEGPARRAGQAAAAASGSANLRVEIAEKGLTREQHCGTGPESIRRARGEEYDLAMRMSLEEARPIAARSQSEMDATDRHLAQLLGISVQDKSSAELRAALQDYKKEHKKEYWEAFDKTVAWRATNTEAGKLGAAEKAEYAALAAEHRILQRMPNDTGTTKSRDEWFAHSGQLYFYGVEPRSVLTDRETRFWRRFGRYLERKGPFPTPDD